MNSADPITVTPVRVADLLADGERMPVYVHVIDHPEARVLVDTGLTEVHPAVADMDPRIYPLSEQAFDIASIDIVVNTHLHFDHCGGNHLFAGTPVYVQRRELDDARSEGFRTSTSRGGRRLASKSDSTDGMPHVGRVFRLNLIAWRPTFSSCLRARAGS